MFLDTSSPKSNMQTRPEHTYSANAAEFPMGMVDPTFSTGAVDHSGTAVDAAVDFSPQTMMDNVLQDIMAHSHFSGEDWFFRDMPE
jgi:hypothetical protein